MPFHPSRFTISGATVASFNGVAVSNRSRRWWWCPSGIAFPCHEEEEASSRYSLFVYIEVESPVERGVLRLHIPLEVDKKVCNGMGKKREKLQFKFSPNANTPSPVEKKKWVVCPGGPCTTNCPKGNALSQSIFFPVGRLAKKKWHRQVPAIARRRGTHDSPGKIKPTILLLFFLPFLPPPQTTNSSSRIARRE